MEHRSYTKYVRISPKKLRFLVDDVKSKLAKEALDQLYYSNKRAAKILYKAIKSALDGAKKDPKVDEASLKIEKLIVEEGPSLKRFRAGGRGIAKPYKRRSSHIKVVLKSEDKSAPKETERKKAKREVDSKKKRKKGKKVKSSKTKKLKRKKRGK